MKDLYHRKINCVWNYYSEDLSSLMKKFRECDMIDFDTYFYYMMDSGSVYVMETMNLVYKSCRPIEKGPIIIW